MSCEKEKVTSHCMRCVFIVYHPPKIMKVKSCLTTTSVKHPVTSRVNPPYLECIHIVEKYAHIRGVNHFLTINANIVG